jgi:hypothetical protein
MFGIGPRVMGVEEQVLRARLRQCPRILLVSD